MDAIKGAFAKRRHAVGLMSATIINESKGNAKLTGINYAWIRLLDVLQPFILHMLVISYVHLKIQNRKKIRNKQTEKITYYIIFVNKRA